MFSGEKETEHKAESPRSPSLVNDDAKTTENAEEHKEENKIEDNLLAAPESNI